jgi:site-specific DNA-methyltransferase (adenine-specific)
VRGGRRVPPAGQGLHGFLLVKNMTAIRDEWSSDDGAIRLILGNCLEVMPLLTGIGAVVTDPPYGLDVAEWDKTVPHYMIELFLKITPGPVVWFGSASNAIDDAKAFPIQPERMMIWSPRFTLSKVAKDGFAYRFHPLWFWRVRKQSFCPWDVFDDMTECGNWWEHKCTKPLSLMVKLVMIVADVGQVILDPFVGSGTTLVACLKTGRRGIGIEIEPKYFQIAVERCKRVIREDKGSFQIRPKPRQAPVGFFKKE